MSSKHTYTHDIMMALSGVTAIAFFFVANFYDGISEFKVLFGSIQIVINIFVFVTWWKGFKASNGFKKFVASWGVVVPVVLALITLYRVILPYLLW